MISEPLIQELAEEKCDGDYCFFKLIFKHCRVEQRTVVQMKCLEKFKYEQSANEGRDIGRYETMMRWVDRGFAESFDKEYGPNKTLSEIYSKTVGM